MTGLAKVPPNAPEWVELFPPGPNIKAVDGRAWRYVPKDLIAAFQNGRQVLAVDYEHGQNHLAGKGFKAPASGWIVELQERGGGLWGRVEWTEAAAKMIVEREYRFISPDFRHRADGTITRLVGAGLVNRPALEMTALSSAQNCDLPELSPFLAIQREARALAAEAHDYREEQARLGFPISIAQAVAICRERAPNLTEDMK